MPTLNAVVLIGLGAAVLLFGTPLVLAVCRIVGFALGWWLTGLLLPSDLGDSLLRVIIAVVVGLILGALVRFLGQWAIRIVAAIAGFVILPMLLGNLGMLGGINELIWAVLGAVLGFVFAVFLTDWALMILSALLGAGLIMNGAAQLSPNFANAAFDCRFRTPHHWHSLSVAAEAVSLIYSPRQWLRSFACDRICVVWGSCVSGPAALFDDFERRTVSLRRCKIPGCFVMFLSIDVLMARSSV